MLDHRVAQAFGQCLAEPLDRPRIEVIAAQVDIGGKQLDRLGNVFSQLKRFGEYAGSAAGHRLGVGREQRGQRQAIFVGVVSLSRVLRKQRGASLAHGLSSTHQRVNNGPVLAHALNRRQGDAWVVVAHSQILRDVVVTGAGLMIG